MAKPEQGYFQTDTVSMNLRQRSVQGAFAVLSVQLLELLINLASTAALARLLIPDDFGLVAMAMALGGFFMLFRDMGLGAATVQRAELTPAQVSGLFWINSGLGVLMAGLMAALGPVLAWFFDEPRLLAVTVALALGFVFGGVTVQHNALLRRQMRFPALASIDIVSLIVGVVTGVLSAVIGAGYWALVLLHLSRQVTAAVGLWLVSGWRPERPARAEGLGSMVRFGANVFGFSFLTYLTRNADDIIIGRTAGATELGVYSKAYSLFLLPVQRVRNPIAAVVVPALSRLQNEPERFRDYYLKAITLLTSIGMPAVAVSFVLAEEAVLVVLGVQWLKVVDLFRMLAPAAFVNTFNIVGSWACVPLGETKRLLRWQMFATPVTLASFVLGAWWGGSLGVAAGFSVSSVVLRLPAIVYLLRGSPIHPAQLLGTIARPAFASLTAGSVLFLVLAGLDLDLAPIILLVGLPLFVVAYAAVWYVIPGGRVYFAEFRSLLGAILSKTASAETTQPK